MLNVDASGVALDAVSGTTENWDEGETLMGHTSIDFGDRSTEMRVVHTNGIAVLTQMPALIAHEINQPVAALMTNVQAALRFLERAQPDLKEVQHALNRIGRLGNRIVEVAGSMRALFQRVPPRKAEFEINKAVREVLSLCQEELAANRVVVKTRFARGLPLLVADRIQLQQVVLNLIRNAVEAMAGVFERARVLSISTDRTASGDLLVTVQDSGTGLDAERIDLMFDACCSTKPDGLGIGLFICRSIIAAHEGRLWAIQSEPHGARFHFTLPLHQGASSAEWSAPKVGPPVTPSCANP